VAQATRTFIVEIDGSGEAHVHAVRSLDAAISGSGDIAYGGHPAHVKRQVDGSGDIAPE
jgi:hypothetical protein